MKISSSFHAQHSPMGAHSSFTVGMFGAEGGMALEKGGPADGGLYLVTGLSRENFINYHFIRKQRVRRSAIASLMPRSRMGQMLFSARRISSVIISGLLIVFMHLVLSLRSARHFSPYPIQRVQARRT